MGVHDDEDWTQGPAERVRAALAVLPTGQREALTLALFDLG